MPSRPELGFEGMIVPQQNAHEAAVVNNLKVYGAGNIKEVIEFFNGTQELTPTLVNTREEFYSQQSNFDLDFAEVKGARFTFSCPFTSAKSKSKLLCWE